jgi:tetratricopeptide (TPR) repeat protein
MLPRLDEVAAASDDRWIRAMTGVVKGEFLQFRGDADAARTLFESAASDFDAEGDGFAYALAITEGSELFEQIGDYDTAAAMLRRGIELADEIGFSGHPLAMRARLGNVETLRGDLDAAERCHREIIDDARARGVPWLHSMAQLGLSAVERRRGNYEEAERLLEAAWNLPRSRAVPYMRSLVQVARGYLADQQGDFEAAFAHQAASLGTSIQLSAPRGVAYSLEGVAGALALSGTPDHHELAARLLGCAHALRVDTGGAMPDAERFDVGRADDRLRSLLGDAAFELQFEAGTTSSAVDLARQVEAIEPHVRPT